MTDYERIRKQVRQEHERIRQQVRQEHDQAMRKVAEEFSTMLGGKAVALFAAVQQRGEQLGMSQQQINNVHRRARQEVERENRRKR